MPSKTYKKQSYLVVEPALSYLAVGEHISSIKWKKVQKEFGDYAKEEMQVVPYCPQLHATLLAQKQHRQNALPPSPYQLYKQNEKELLKEIEESIKEEMQLATQHKKQVQRINKLCAANQNVASIFSKSKKHKAVHHNNSNNILQFPKK